MLMIIALPTQTMHHAYITNASRYVKYIVKINPIMAKNSISLCVGLPKKFFKSIKDIKTKDKYPPSPIKATGNPKNLE